MMSPLLRQGDLFEEPLLSWLDPGFRRVTEGSSSGWPSPS